MYRPAYHFTPPSMWMNDPNGLIFIHGQYHFFYQHYPEKPLWGPMHWGHALSEDLIHWKHLPIALAPDELGLIFSGSAVYDPKQAAIAAMYTNHGDHEQQSLAYSTDGIHFHKYEGNPVIPNTTYPDFRDPKLFRNTSRSSWGLVLAAGDRAFFYNSPDLIHWEKTGEFGPFPYFNPCVWECPDLFPLMGPDGRERWVLVVSMGNTKDAFPADTYYWIGTWDGWTFTAETEPLWVDFARDDYAGVTYYGASERIFMGWASQWAYANQLPSGDTDSFRGQATLARRLSLVQTAFGPRLAAHPITPAMTRASALSDSFALHLTGNGPCEILLSNGTETFRAGISTENEVYMDRTGMEPSVCSESFDQPSYSRCRASRFQQGSYELTLFFDVSIAEMYVDQGTRVGTMLLYPKTPFTQVTVNGADWELYVPDDQPQGGLSLKS